MVFAMIVIGAITRLTESGLSIAEWKPLIGAIPPLDEAEWNRLFSLYQQTPEFQKKNFWMELPDFKTIFFWEWLHRLWGRLIGLVFTLPLVFFWMKRQISARLACKLLALLFLGALQGFMGWYMVQSGLVDLPAVSPFRLAAHLTLALLIYSFLLWFAMPGLSLPAHPQKALHIHGWCVMGFVVLTILWGAFTAGLDAGLVYNETFPQMGGQWVPPDFWKFSGLFENLLHNHPAVQFMHRWLALSTTGVTLSFWLHGAIKGHRFRALDCCMGMVFLQVALGITTLLSGVLIPVAVAHQGGAVMLLSVLVLCQYQTHPARL